MKARWTLPLLALLSPLFFPWQVSLALSLPGSYVFPLTGLFVGLLADLLYAPSVPSTGSLIGLLVTLAAYFVRIYVKRNIMD